MDAAFTTNDSLYDQESWELTTPSAADDGLFESDEESSQQGDASRADGVSRYWAVDHASGHHKFRAPRFNEKALGGDLKPADALRMLQEKHTIDFGSRSSGGAQAKPTNAFFPQFFLDFLSIVGRPGCAITRPDGPIFDNITVSFQNWAAPYSAKHVSGIPFDITGRTFRVAQAATREVWFIVMHPIVGEMTELPGSAGAGRRARNAAAERSGMPATLARQLAAYITAIFQSSELLGEGVEPCWRPGGRHSQRITSTRWASFQQEFMDGWAAWAATHDVESFWRQHEPAFHAYDYGANIEIEVGETLYTLPREIHTCRDTDSEEEEDEGSADDAGGDPTEQEAEEAAADNGSDHGGPSGDALCQRMISDSEGVRKLIEELSARFRLDSIATISYALAVCLNCQTAGGETRCLLADRNMLAREYASSRDFTFYPQAFHPAYGNFSSSRPPSFLNSLSTAMRGNMSDRNEGADVLSFGYFQGYSNIKRSVRHSPHDLLATKGYATAALTVPASYAAATAAGRGRREALLRTIRGQATPEEPEESKPFARERRQIEVAIEAEEVAYRLEQVVSLDVRRMLGGERTFAAVIRPIFQLIRFFLIEHESYVHIFRAMPPAVFPRIMCAYSRVFELAMAEMERRFVLGGERGLDLAHSEAVAVLDRLGGYLFTGHDRHLPKSILRPLGTVDSLRSGAWPYIDPGVLDLGASDGGRTTLHIGRWPRAAKTGRLLLLHVGELRHHYGAHVASNREVDIRFSLMGEAALGSRSAIAEFATELLKELWIPQTKQFIAQQLRRRLYEGGEVDGRPATADETKACEAAVAAWEAAADAFTWEALQRLEHGLGPGGSRVAVTHSRTRTRHDFAAELIRAVSNEKGIDAHAPKGATWPLPLRLAMAKRGKAAAAADAREWAGVLGSQMLAARIEWVPDAVRGRLTSRNVARLHGQEGLQPALTGAVGSLRRAAREAEIKHEEAKRDRQARSRPATIDFGCGFPFTNIPPLVTGGFERAKATFGSKGDAKVLDHYQLAIDCLAANIDDPLCQLMLATVLTVCSSSETPEAAPGGRGLGTTAKRKEPGQLALVMTMRMMWFLYPASFPWVKGSGGTAYDVPEMTKKIEHKGCSNRMLCQLGWVVSRSNRDSPRNTDVQLRPREELLETLRLLKSAIKRPEDFIAIVFRSRDGIWVERCGSIINRP